MGSNKRQNITLDNIQNNSIHKRFDNHIETVSINIGFNERQTITLDNTEQNRTEQVLFRYKQNTQYTQ